VRPGWFDYNASDEPQLVFLQGDTRTSGSPSDGVIARRQIAEVLVSSLVSEDAIRKTFELVAIKIRSSGRSQCTLRRSIPTPELAWTVCAILRTCRWNKSRKEFASTLSRCQVIGPLSHPDNAGQQQCTHQFEAFHGSDAMSQCMGFITGVSSCFGRQLTDQPLRHGDSAIGIGRNTDKVSDLM
jgi:hypothetical protein